jgi:hypothetical protein
MPNTPDQELDPVVKAGHSFANAVIDAQIGEQRRVIVYSEGRIVELEELKHVELEEKNQALRSFFPTPA